MSIYYLIDKNTKEGIEMVNFYYVYPDELDKLRSCSLELSYIRTACDHAVKCSNSERFIIAVDDELLETDKVVHIERHKKILSMLKGYNKFPDLDNFINRFKYYNPLIWIDKTIRNENLCNNKDMEWYLFQNSLRNQ